MGTSDTNELSQLASALRGLGKPRTPEAARSRILQTAQARVALAQAAPARRPWYQAPLFRTLVGAVAVFVMLSAGGLWLTLRSLPGDALYPVSRSLEARGLALMPAEQRAYLELQVLNRRAAEAQRLAQRRAVVPPEMIAELALGANRIAAEPEAWGGQAAAVGTVHRQVAALQLVASAQPANRQVAGALEMAATAQRDLQRVTSEQ